MDEFKYPLRFKSKYGGAIVEFDGLYSGTLIDSGSASRGVGEYSTSWVEHTDSRWTPVAMPSTTKRKLHDAVGGFK